MRKDTDWALVILWVVVLLTFGLVSYQVGRIRRTETRVSVLETAGAVPAYTLEGAIPTRDARMATFSAAQMETLYARVQMEATNSPLWATLFPGGAPGAGP